MKKLFTKMEHVGLGAFDTTALANWYCDVFQLMRLYVFKGTPPSYFLTDYARSFVIEIFPTKNAAVELDINAHFCFAADDFDVTLSYLRDKGIKYGEIKNIMKNGRTVFFPDPVGHIIQIVHRPEELWQT